MNEASFNIAVIKGDGIGVDVTDATLAVVESAHARVGGFRLHTEQLLAGAGYFKDTGKDIAPGAEARAAKADAIFLGASGS